MWKQLKRRATLIFDRGMSYFASSSLQIPQGNKNIIIKKNKNQSLRVKMIPLEQAKTKQAEKEKEAWGWPGCYSFGLRVRSLKIQVT